MKRKQKTLLIIVGDFNFKMETKEQRDNKNKKGEMQCSYLNKQNLFYLNTFFEKNKKHHWT